MQRIRFVAVIVLVAAVNLIVASAPMGEARKDGVSGQATTGATCHGGGKPDTSVQPVLDGLPSKYEPEKKYSLAIAFNGGPPYSKAGFDLEATKGRLTVPSGESNVQITTKDSFGGQAGQATHKTPATRSWKVDWTAPPAGSGRVTFNLAVNSVNGNDQPDILDKWNVMTKSVDEKNVAPKPVQLAKAAQTGPGAVALNWTAATDPDVVRYEVHRGTRAAFPLTFASKVAEIKERSATGVVVEDLEGNATYYFRIKLVDKGGLTSESNEESIALKPMAEAVPVDGPPTTAESPMIGYAALLTAIAGGACLRRRERSP